MESKLMLKMFGADQKFALEQEFCKSFTLETEWPLPNSDDMFTEPIWDLDDFQHLKDSLNRTKQRLNSYDLDKWHAHTSKMNPAGLVISHVRNHVKPDFLTQAWCKFYEIACDLPLQILNDGGGSAVFNSVHLCEAPGAFVSSLNHYIAINHQHTRLKWLAMTLNPYHESNGHPDIVTDDRLILDTLDNWVFGPDYTGDIFQPGYAEHLRLFSSAKFDGMDACLVTADGSIDCSDDPGEQETVVMRLHDYETMVALNVLCVGGSLVLKMFTAFECNTICRMYLLCSLFRSVVVRKPVTSKPGNSEVYVVCTGYAGRSVALPYIRQFFAAATSSYRSLFPLSQIPVEFRARLYECCEYFTLLQIRTIERNINAWSHKERSYRAIEALQRAVCREFVVRYGLRTIRYDQQLGLNPRTPTYPSSWKNNGGNGFVPRKSTVSKARTNNSYKSRNAGLSYAEKLQMRHADLDQEAVALYQELIRCDEWTKSNSRDFVCWGRREHLTVNLSDVQYRTGKPVASIKGSKFCSESLIHCRLRVLSKFPAVKSATDAVSRSCYYRFKLGWPDTVVCDLTETCATYRDDHVAQQYHCMQAVTAALRGLAPEDDLLIIGYPLYAQMSVACFFTVASMFRTHGLLNPDREYGHAFAFTGYQKHDGWLDALDKARDYLSPAASSDGVALVSWIPIKVLFEQWAYSDIVVINNLCIIHEIEPILKSFMNRVS